MDWQNEKCVMVIDESLSRGLLANMAAITGIIEFSVPILRGSPEIIRQIREALYRPDFQDLTVAAFSDLAQGCKTYSEFVEKMGRVPEHTLQYFGAAICGPKKKVNKLTGSMPLLRQPVITIAAGGPKRNRLRLSFIPNPRSASASSPPGCPGVPCSGARFRQRLP